MNEQPDQPLPAGRQPYDALNGMRVGAFAGAAAAAIVALVFGAALVWLLLVGVVLGGVAGYQYERRAIGRSATSSARGRRRE